MELSSEGRRSLVVALALVLAATACRDNDGHPDSGSSGDAQRDTAVTDSGPADQAVDRPAVPDKRVEPDGPLLESNMGEGCTHSSECKPGSPDCLMYDSRGKRGICSRECTQDDPNTPLFNEDDCPDGFLCGAFRFTTATYNFCLETCTPSLTSNPCPASSRTTCHPASSRFSDILSQAVCFYPACAEDRDCPVVSDTPCVKDSACTAIAADAFCDPDLRRCARPGKCTPGGLCGEHSFGNDSAKVGAPCASDLDCPGNGVCLSETVDAGKVVYRNGYCTVRFCSFASDLPEFSCPTGSSCHNLFYGGLCHMNCALADPVGCRGNPGDMAGDYECYAWNNLYIGGKAVSVEPVCQAAANQTCDSLGTTLDCSSLGLAPDATNMRCRDRLTGATLPPDDPHGLCLDDTTSGPFANPATDAGGPDATVLDAAVPDMAPDIAPVDAGPDVAPDAVDSDSDA